LTRVRRIDIVIGFIPHYFFTRLSAENAKSEKVVGDKNLILFWASFLSWRYVGVKEAGIKKVVVPVPLKAGSSNNN
jgi:hypothetical protein